MAFSFGFAGDDIDMDDAELQDEGVALSAQSKEDSLPALITAQKHQMKEWLPTFPSQISYNKLSLGVSNTTGETSSLTVARREVFDIRTQLMAEDTADHENEELISGLEKGDIKPNFYEGGFKTWECALDLGKLVASEGVTSKEGDLHVIELGAGTAVPSLALFAQLISQPDRSSVNKKTHFTFADYNSAVLRLVTLPNLLLTWNYIVTHRDVVSKDQADGQPQPQQEEEELDITPELLEAFEKDLVARGISVEFISGAWSPTFVDLVFSSVGSDPRETLVLASETIYSPASLTAFSETLVALLGRSAGSSRALVAAKKVYFGVGGGVDEFLAVFRGVCGEDMEVKERVDVKSEGVGRIVLEIAHGRG